MTRAAWSRFSTVGIVILSEARDLAFITPPMRRRHTYYVYMLTSSSRRALYTGITNNLDRRLEEHKTSEEEGFAKRYKAFRLVHFETFQYVNNAIRREKEI